MADLFPCHVLLTGDALDVDPEQDGHAVARPPGDLGGRHTPLSHVETATCRRS